ncbi:hypothetical protein [Paenibacillus sp.]|uniref:hypothetical protein n=1 Tax=Paenibacillus sp. TaxID=58172 RepID=UPI002811EDD2|nr:hypothetical protein [Paenibacillus sp.]
MKERRRRPSAIAALWLCIALGALTACEREPGPEPGRIDGTTESTQPAGTETEPFPEHAFDRVAVPPGWAFRHERADEDGRASYVLREYAVDDAPAVVRRWFLEELDRVGGTVVWSHGGEEDASQDVDYGAIAEIPSPAGNETLSVYYGSTAGAPNVALLRTRYADGLQEQPYLEDHPLVVTVPMADGSEKDVFRGYYEHEHTDIYLVHFYTAAFFKELERTEGALRAEPAFRVGYFDEKGEELDPYENEVTESSKFGVKFDPGALPEGERERAAFLRALARTALLGDRSIYRDVPADKALYFWIGAKQIAVVTAGDLL